MTVGSSDPLSVGSSDPTDGSTSDQARVPSVLPRRELARLISRAEAGDPEVEDVLAGYARPDPDTTWIVGITGAPGAGKSTLVNALVGYLRARDQRVAVLAVDPSSPYSGGALLGDRIRMSDHIGDQDVFIRSLAARGRVGGVADAVPVAARALVAAGFDHVLIETVGVGQSEVDIAGHADTTVVVSAPGLGDSIQADKAGVLEVADVLVVNKSDRPGAKDTVRDLVASVRLAHTAAHAWRCPVVSTRADVGDGIGELHDEITRHRDFLIASGELEARRGQRRVDDWRERCRRHVLAELDVALGDETGQELARQVASGALTPSAAAERLQAHVRDVAVHGSQGTDAPIDTQEGPS